MRRWKAPAIAGGRHPGMAAEGNAAKRAAARTVERSPVVFVQGFQGSGMTSLQSLATEKYFSRIILLEEQNAEQ